MLILEETAVASATTSMFTPAVLSLARSFRRQMPLKLGTNDSVTIAANITEAKVNDTDATDIDNKTRSSKSKRVSFTDNNESNKDDLTGTDSKQHPSSVVVSIARSLKWRLSSRVGIEPCESKGLEEVA